MTSRILWIVGGIVLIAAIGVGVFLYVHSRTQEPISSPISNPFPIATSNPNGTSGSPTITLPLQGGSSVVAQNFIDNGITAEDPANEGNYYLAGEIGYCDEAGNCPGTIVTNDYNIVYFSNDKAFAISLGREPLGEIRRAAETYLMQALGINQAQMCALNYYIGTTVYVNQTYGSLGNLGFSFCEGATQLP